MSLSTATGRRPAMGDRRRADRGREIPENKDAKWSVGLRHAPDWLRAVADFDTDGYF